MMMQVRAATKQLPQNINYWRFLATYVKILWIIMFMSNTANVHKEY